MPTDTPQQDPIVAPDNNDAPAGAPLTSGLAQSGDTGAPPSSPMPIPATGSPAPFDGAGGQPPLTVEDRVRAILGEMLDPFEQRLQKLEAKHGFLSEDLDHLFKLFGWPRKPR